MRVRVPDPAGGRADLRARYTTMPGDLLALRDWLKGLGVTHVATNVLGVSGRLMLQALVSGSRDPEILADLAKGRLRKKIPALRAALEGDFNAHHAMLIGHILAHIDYLEQAIAAITTEVETLIAPFQAKAERLDQITGVGQVTAQVILAELGPDMTKFPTHRHAASWAKICPGNHESAGKRRSGRTGKGNRYLRTALIEAAQAAAHSKDTYLRAQYEQIKRRHGHAKAIVAVAHSILVAAYYILRDDVDYKDLGADHYARRADPERQTKRLVAQLERLGHHVTLQERAA